MLPTVVTIVGVCGFRVLWIATVFQIPSFHTLEVLYASYAISWGITTVAQIICYVAVRKKLQAIGTVAET